MRLHWLWFSLLATLLAPGLSSACQCIDIRDLSTSTLVFEGEVIASTRWRWLDAVDDGTLLEMRRFAFRVERTLKGPTLSEVVVETPVHNCGLELVRGERYRIYAYSWPDAGIQWLTDVCTPSSALGKPE